jgi:hypothetical protein
MRKTMVAALVGGLLTSACAPVAEQMAPQPAPQPAPPPADATAIPSGTHLNVTLDQELNTTDTRVGDSFIVTVNQALVATNGAVVVPQGTQIQGMVTGVAAPGGRDPAALRLNFLRINLDGEWHPLTAEVAGTHVPMDTRQDHAQHAQAAVTGAVAGAVLGAVVSGRLRDALIGAALGAGAGTVISLGMGTPTEAVLPAGTHMTLRTADRITLR